MSKEADIPRALFDAVIAMGIGMVPPMPETRIQFPDVTFDPPADPDENADNRYLSVVHFTNTTEGYDWGNEVSTHIGILQITLVDPHQRGEVQAAVVASQISDYFAKGEEFRYGDAVVKIEQPPTRLTMIQEGHRALYPVSIRYRCS